MILYRIVSTDSDPESEIGRVRSLAEVRRFVAAIPHKRWKVRVETVPNDALYLPIQFPERASANDLVNWKAGPKADRGGDEE